MLTSSPSPSPRGAFSPPSPHFYRPRSSPHTSHPQSPRSYARPAVAAPSQPLRDVASTVQLLSTTHTAAIAVAPPKQTSDAGTQYTPPDFPPTSNRSTLHPATHEAAPSDHLADAVVVPAPPQGVDPTPSAPPDTPPPSISSTATTVVAAPPTPAETQVRVTPSSTLQPGAATTTSQRRPCSPSSPSSPVKRQRPHPATSKPMPSDYTQTDPKELCALIADMLLELIRYNDEIPLKDGHLTRFHSRAPPGISVHDYLVRLTVHATLPPPILLAMVFYIDRLCALYPTFTINSLTVHRFLITAATVASKGLSDSFWTNNTYARVGGVSVKELALLELELLSRVQWRIVPTPETLSDYYRNLVERSEGHFADTESSLDSIDSGEPMDVEQPGHEDG